MKVDSVLLTLPQETRDANSIKDMVLQQLLTDGVINQEQSELYSERWQVILIKASWFQKWWQKFRAGRDDTYYYKYVKF